MKHLWLGRNSQKEHSMKTFEETKHFVSATNMHLLMSL